MNGLKMMILLQKKKDIKIKCKLIITYVNEVNFSSYHIKQHYFSS